MLSIEQETAATRFVLALAQALHEHGTPAHQLEESLAQVARAVGLRDAQFLSTPTALQMAVGEGPEQRVYLRRANAERLDLDSLTELGAIVDEVLAGTLDVEAGERRLAPLRGRPPRYGPRAMRWASATASGTASIFLGGGLPELIVSSILGYGVGRLAQWTALRPRARTVHEPLTALVASIVATLTAAAWPGMSEGVVLVSALIMLVPGLSLTIAMTELAGGHLVSGTARLAGAMTPMLTMLFGAALGHKLAESVHLPALLQIPATALPAGTWLAALAAATVAFTVLLGARAREAGYIGVACLLGYGASQWGAWALGTELGAFAGAAVVGLVSNGFARYMRRPTTLLRLPGLLLLVPGSLGFRSLSSFLAADTVAGTDGLFRVALVTVALAIGMFAADLLLPSRRTL